MPNAEGDNMYYDIGFFSEMNLSAHNCGSIKDSIVDCLKQGGFYVV